MRLHLNVFNKNITTINQINSHFNLNLINSEEIYTHPKIIQLEKRFKDDEIFEHYTNVGNPSSSQYLAYFMNVNNTKNIGLIQKMVFLDLFYLREILRENSEVNLLILGIQTPTSSYHNFLKLDKPIFMIISKSKNNVSYEYQSLKINLEEFYKFQKAFSVHLKNTVSTDSLYKEATTAFLNETERQEISLDLDIEPESNEFEYKYNFYRLYSENLGLNMIMNKFEDSKNVETNFVNFFSQNEEVKCDFEPKGETLYECKQLCKIESEHCNSTDCSKLCDNCSNSKCKWNLANLEKLKALVPSKTKIRGFSGNTRVKLSWIKPYSKYQIESYYILHESSQIQNEFNVYIYKSQSNLNEYIINNLANNTTNIFYIISKNKFGLSEKSNKVSLIPAENKHLEEEDVSMDTYSDSIQNYYNSRYSDININVKSEYNKLLDTIEINQLKDKLVDKLVFDGFEESSKFNINVY